MAKIKVLVAAGKYWPAYSGPAVRIDNLYRDPLMLGNVECIGILSQLKPKAKLDGFSKLGISTKHFLFDSEWPWIVRKIVGIILHIWILIYCDIRFRNVDVVHVFGDSCVCSAVAWWANYRNKYLMIELVTAKTRSQMKFLSFIPYVNSFYGKVVAISNKVYLSDRSNSGLNDIFYWVRPNPVNPALFSKKSRVEKNAFKEAMSCAPENLLVGFVGKFMTSKNQSLLVRAVRQVRNAHLVLAGPGFNEQDPDYFSTYHDDLDQLTKEGRLTLIKRLVPAHEIIPFLDCYCAPSFDEGLGTTILEALASGLITLVNAKEKAFTEHIIDGENGYHFNSKDELATILNGLCLKPESRSLDVSRVDHLLSSTIHSQYLEIFMRTADERK